MPNGLRAAPAEHEVPAALAAPGQLHYLLMRFARSKLRNTALAEDAVSETMLAYLELKGRDAAQTRSTAWLYSVLRHKIVDQLRKQQRESASGDLGLDSEEIQTVWGGDAQPEAEPERVLAQRQLSDILFRACDRLPPNQRQVFLMREAWGWDSASICSQLAVSEGNLWVLLHRARKKLRALLKEEGAAAGLAG